jgi:hypothetical protein
LLQAELAEARQEKEEAREIHNSNMNRYALRAEQAESRAAAAYDLLREARLSLDPFVDTDLCQVIDAAMGKKK